MKSSAIVHICDRGGVLYILESAEGCSDSQLLIAQLLVVQTTNGKHLHISIYSSCMPIASVKVVKFIHWNVFSLLLFSFIIFFPPVFKLDTLQHFKLFDICPEFYVVILAVGPLHKVVSSILQPACFSAAFHAWSTFCIVEK